MKIYLKIILFFNSFCNIFVKNYNKNNKIMEFFGKKLEELKKQKDISQASISNYEHLNFVK